LAARLLESTNTVRALRRQLLESQRKAGGAQVVRLERASSDGVQAELSALRVFAGLEPPPERHTAPVSCRMADGLYMQADGSMPCYCSAGITRILGKVDGAELMHFYRGRVMTTLRAHLADGVFPWPECGPCRVKTFHPERAPEVNPREIPIIHLEPTSVCNLRCPGCHATEVMEGRAPRRRTFLPFEKFKEMIDSIDIPVRQIAFCGYGEPLLNADVPKMIAYAKSNLSPPPSCSIDTNANIRRLDVAALIASKVNLIRFALDGAIQENYVKYRRRGDLDLGLKFIRRVAAERERQQAPTKLVWKYVIFDHNDTIEEIERAIRLCAEIGLGFDYSRAAGILPGTEHRDSLVPRIQELLERHGVRDFVGGQLRNSARQKFGEEDAWKYASA
jgi:MoaA/NifB/PqqE/SkfB family radical SAM enzyme